MNERAAMTSASVLTKTIPLKSIRFNEETNPRQDLVQDRVSFFQELFQTPDHNVPPLEVLLVQGGDPKSAIYLILDGIHRYEALKAIKASDALCNVHTEPAYTLSDLEDKKVMGLILEMSCIYNVNSPLPLTREERIGAAVRFHDLKYSLERIAQAVCAPSRTVRRWLEDINRYEKEELKETILAELKNGAAVNELARIYKGRASELTIMRWKKETGVGIEDGGVTKWPSGQNDTLPKGAWNLKPPKPLIPGEPPDTGLPTDEGPPSGSDEDSQREEEQQDRTAATLRQIDDLIAKLPWSGDADDYIIADHLPRLAKKSRTLKTALSAGGISTAYEDLRGTYEDEKKKHAETKATSVERQRRIEELEKENRKLRSDSKSSDHSREWARKVVHQSLSGHLDILGLLRSAIIDHRITNPMKRVTTVPKEADPTLNDIALACSYRVVAHLEWAGLHHLENDKSISSFYDFLGIIESFPMVKDKDFMARVRKLDKQFSSK
jgi:hypothetical protein